MAEFLQGASVFVLAMVALGLVRILRGPNDADRMMAASGVGAVVDVALTLALLAAFATIAFVKASVAGTSDDGAPGRE
jgi:multicomponent Na+:H+ antiporter subunit F